MTEPANTTHRKEALIIVLILVVILTILFFGRVVGLQFKELTGGDVLSIISAMFVVAVFMERSVEAILTPVRTPDRQQIEQRLEIAKKAAEAAEAAEAVKVEVAKAQGKDGEAEAAVQAANASATTDAEVASKAAEEAAREAAVKVVTAKAAAKAKTIEAEEAAEALKDDQGEPIVAADRFKLEHELQTYKLETAQRAYWLSFGFGLAISLVGIRALASLVEPDSLEGLSANQGAFFAFFDVILTGGVIAGGSAAIDKIGRRISEFFQFYSATDPKPSANP